ncbi:methylated-DNA--[protein]-cysteine S-methyltransferase [Ideonella sp. 4Y11]|uniref:methylated-DNA--[protein]-cysteine S-methyltransferase n=1 Tax=Ideonella aquatica TaxID=2824119 RepID=A0A940YT91_9BURK|nr:methylated-DNA--[protein]-cysteine S-methyltransferase [Ideonella aquatica]MBQ0961448.1 methylated-DNA--[protein]-cysteine S-methyltransferase [Ideonella aquatica]
MNTRRFAAQARIDTPLGPMTVAVTTQGLAGLWFDGQAHHPGPIEAPLQPSHPWIRQAQAALARYWSAPGAPLPALPPLDLGGTPWQQAVWQALLAIPPGHRRRYGELAAQLGRPRAARAVGAAVGRNPVSVLVPCHRVTGQDGSLTGYAGGLPRKQALLDGESRPS